MTRPQKGPPTLVDGKLANVSATQIRTFLSCPTKWYLEKVEGWPKKPPQKGAALGAAQHKLVEDYLNGLGDRRTGPSANGHEVLANWEKLAPVKGGPGVVEGTIEGELFTLGGVKFTGYYDFFCPPCSQTNARTVSILDHKFLKDPLKYAKTAEELYADEQLALYGAWALRKYPQADAVLFAHHNYPTVGRAKPYETPIVATRDHVLQKFGALCKVVDTEMAPTAALGKGRVGEVAYHHDACYAFGQCDFFDACPNSVVNRPPRPGFVGRLEAKESNMTMPSSFAALFGPPKSEIPSIKITNTLPGEIESINIVATVGGVTTLQDVDACDEAFVETVNTGIDRLNLTTSAITSALMDPKPPTTRRPRRLQVKDASAPAQSTSPSPVTPTTTLAPTTPTETVLPSVAAATSVAVEPAPASGLLGAPAFCFLDIETTGLDPHTGALLEIAMVVTDKDLMEIDNGTVVIKQPASAYANIDPYVEAMHTKSGLLAELPAAKDTLRQAEVQCLYMLGKHFAQVGQVAMAGSSIHFDRAWLKVHMPALEAAFSYRNVDVSSLAPALGVDAPKVPAAKHRALDDIRRSILILKTIRAEVLK